MGRGRPVTRSGPNNAKTRWTNEQVERAARAHWERTGQFRSWKDVHSIQRHRLLAAMHAALETLDAEQEGGG